MVLCGDPLWEARRSDLSLPPDSYIYSIVPSGDGVAAISSDDSLRLVENEYLELLPDGVISRVHEGVTCLQGQDGNANGLITAGRDRFVRCWDRRTQSKVYEAKCDGPVLAICGSRDSRTIAVGTELTNHQAVVMLWDIRSDAKPLLQYSESHSDDVVSLAFHPSLSNRLLSGSTDGLLNIYDTSIVDEEDALRQVFNTRSSVHQTGFLTDGEIYATTHDEQLSIFALEDSSGDCFLGNIRDLLDCQYIINVTPGSSDHARIAVGKQSEERVDIIWMEKESGWKIDWETPCLNLVDGHGENIVRSLCLSNGRDSFFTAGEDGLLRVWTQGQCVAHA